MPIRVVVVHDDRAFLDPLAVALKDAGYEVEALQASDFTAEPPRRTKLLEITVSRATGNHAGLRLRVTGLPAEPYAGILGDFLADPVSVAGVVNAMTRFQ